MPLLVIRHVLLLIVLLLPFFPVAAYASTPEPPAVPPDYVVDLAGVIKDDARAQLNGYLGELEQKTTAQMVILTVRSLDGEGIDEFTLRTAEKWKLGQKKKDNGVLMVVAIQERKYRFEVGYGLEGVLPDSFVGSLGRAYLVPNFRKGDYSAGISEAALAIVRTIASNEGVAITGLPDRGENYEQYGGGAEYRISPLRGIILLAVLIVVMIFAIKHPGICILLFFSSGRGGGGWSGGGGFGGGGDGGFGGGGGGGFGGGGASGGW